MSNISKVKLPNGTTYDINAVTVNGHTVEKDVPSDAKFTDTTYVFNTAYNATSNKAATMTDISTAVGSAMEGSY